MSEEQLRRLLASARRECAPRVDVAERVMGAIRGDARAEPAPLGPLAWLAAGAAAIALLAVPMGLELWELLSDPLIGLVSDVVWWLL